MSNNPLEISNRLDVSMPWTLEERRRELAALDAAELWERFKKAAQFTAEGWLQAALVLEALDKKGEDTSRLRISFRTFLRRIANAQLLPEVLVEFGARPMLARAIAKLPVPDQRRLMEGEPVRVLELIDGQTTHTLQEPSALTNEQIAQVFAPDHIRTEAEQRNWLVSRRAKSQMPRPERVDVFHVDYARGGVTHRGQFISLSVLVEAVRILRRR